MKKTTITLLLLLTLTALSACRSGGEQEAELATEQTTPAPLPDITPTPLQSGDTPPLQIEELMLTEDAPVDEDYLDTQIFFDAILNKNIATCDKIKGEARKQECKDLIN